MHGMESINDSAGQSADNLHLIWALNVWVTVLFLQFNLFCYIGLLFFYAVGLLGQSPDGKLWSVHATLVKLRVQFAFICTSSSSALSGCLISTAFNSLTGACKEGILHPP